MSAWGHLQAFRASKRMSALPPESGHRYGSKAVRFGPSKCFPATKQTQGVYEYPPAVGEERRRSGSGTTTTIWIVEPEQFEHAGADFLLRGAQLSRAADRNLADVAATNARDGVPEQDRRQGVGDTQRGRDSLVA